MNKVKYVVIEVKGVEYAIVFNKLITHNDFNRLKVTSGIRDWNRGDIVSGGFMSLIVEDGVINVSVYGRSESANVDSRPEDVGLIKIALNLGM